MPSASSSWSAPRAPLPRDRATAGSSRWRADPAGRGRRPPVRARYHWSSMSAGASTTFHDHFSDASAAYAAARPTYPDALYRFIASVAPSKARAWDCATGNGQAARGLAQYFQAVDATDASAEQIAAASAHARVRYSV